MSEPPSRLARTAAELAAQTAEAVLAARLASATTDPLVDAAVSQVATKLQ